MFKKLFFKILKSLTPEEKGEVVKILKDKTSKKSVKKKIRGEKKKMKKEEKIEEKTEEKEKVEEKPVEEKEKVEEKPEEKVEKESVETQPDEIKEPENTVQETEPSGNGVAIDDLVTKDELTARLAAFEAKFDSVVKENQDLKDKISGMQEKYENKDFGASQKQGLQKQDRSANESFEEYSRNFM